MLLKIVSLLLYKVPYSSHKVQYILGLFILVETLSVPGKCIKVIVKNTCSEIGLLYKV